MATDTFHVIHKLVTLPRGWNMGYDEPPTKATRNKALIVNAELLDQGFTQTHAQPLPDGGIVVSSLKDGTCIRITVLEDGTADVVQSCQLASGEEVRQRNVRTSFASALNIIRRIDQPRKRRGGRKT